MRRSMIIEQVVVITIGIGMAVAIAITVAISVAASPITGHVIEGQTEQVVAPHPQCFGRTDD